MVISAISVFILFWIAIIWDFKKSSKYGQGEFLEDWELPIINHENLFEFNGRTWEYLENHPNGELLRVFNKDMTDYEYKETLE